MLLGYGLRAGGIGRAFAAIGAILIGPRAPFWSALLGLVVEVAVVLSCGGLYAWLTQPVGENRFAWAVAIGGSVAAILLLLARAAGGSIALVLTPGDVVAIGVTIAVALPIGMRLAPSRV